MSITTRFMARSRVFFNKGPIWPARVDDTSPMPFTTIPLMSIPARAGCARSPLESEEVKLFHSSKSLLDGNPPEANSYSPTACDAQRASNIIDGTIITSMVKIVMTKAASPALPLSTRSTRSLSGCKANVRIAAQSRAEENGARILSIWYNRIRKKAKNTKAKKLGRIINGGVAVFFNRSPLIKRLPVCCHMGCELHSFEQALGVGTAFAGNIVCSSVVNRGPDDGEPHGDIHGIAESQHLEGS